MKPLRKSVSCVKTKTNSNFAVNLAEMLKEANIHVCLFDESHFSNTVLKIEGIEINCVNVGRRSEAAKVLFQ